MSTTEIYASLLSINLHVFKRCLCYWCGACRLKPDVAVSFQITSVWFCLYNWHINWSHPEKEKNWLWCSYKGRIIVVCKKVTPSIYLLLKEPIWLVWSLSPSRPYHSGSWPWAKRSHGLRGSCLFHQLHLRDRLTHTIFWEKKKNLYNYYIWLLFSLVWGIQGFNKV